MKWAVLWTGGLSPPRCTRYCLPIPGATGSAACGLQRVLACDIGVLWAMCYVGYCALCLGMWRGDSVVYPPSELTRVSGGCVGGECEAASSGAGWCMVAHTAGALRGEWRVASGSAGMEAVEVRSECVEVVTVAGGGLGVGVGVGAVWE
jgi:hypothetical protein